MSRSDAYERYICIYLHVQMYIFTRPSQVSEHKIFSTFTKPFKDTQDQ